MSELLYETTELDQRKGDKLTVTLWWVKETMQTYVSVLDSSTMPPTEEIIDVPEGVLPHYVFTHPMAFCSQESA